ncbi:hypothetical protein [Uliginosibacterium gangwonense]|uniref:hypothetical protein n=1 Tax=Uliginosibacterium gangwonense TaxID=392736 RepID=UPI00037786B8|nr:hypothetical protein [Uliginosibacterium gangwonense]
MYPVSLGYSTAVARITALLQNGHDAEALVTSVFTAEKTLRRTLRQLVVSAGFPSSIADKIVGNLRGLDAVKNAWELYDPKHRKLADILQAPDWKVFKEAAEMRNKLVHGEKVYALAVCRKTANDVLAALTNVKSTLDTEYNYSGWTKALSRRTSRLHVDPKVRIAP